MKYCGIDLHSSNSSVVVVTDEADRIVVSRRCRNDLGQILRVLAPHQAELAGVVVESTYNWYWLVDGLINEKGTDLFEPSSQGPYRSSILIQRIHRQ
jgi:hypothetical protein